MLKKLQKEDKDTQELIKRVQKYLFSIGIRTSKERAWEVFQAVYRIPYELMVEKNTTIEYQGAGKHLTHKHGDQLMVIKNLGKFALQGVSVRKSKKKHAAVKFTPSHEIKEMIKNNVEVINPYEEEQNND